jgi:hypothetical protein
MCRLLDDLPGVVAADVPRDLLEDVVGDWARVTADAAYDTIAFYESAGARNARVVVPPATTATVSRRGPRSTARDRTITHVNAIGCQRSSETA